MKDRIINFLGVATPIAGVGVSASAVETWLRVGSLAVGFAVGLAILGIRLIDLRKKWRDRDK